MDNPTSIYIQTFFFVTNVPNDAIYALFSPSDFFCIRSFECSSRNRVDVSANLESKVEKCCSLYRVVYRKT